MEIITAKLKIVDNKEGIGATPNGQNIDYMGVRVWMKPSKLLKCSARFTPKQDHVDYLVTQIEAGEKIGSPFLSLELPEEWIKEKYNDRAKVIGHEGRHRCLAIQKVFGDKELECHLFLRMESGFVRKPIIDNLPVINELKTLISENNKTVRNVFKRRIR